MNCQEIPRDLTFDKGLLSLVHRDRRSPKGQHRSRIGIEQKTKICLKRCLALVQALFNSAKLAAQTHTKESLMLIYMHVKFAH